MLECGTPGEEGFEGAALAAEAFCPALAVVELAGGADGDVDWAAREAAPFCNSEQVVGSLSCTILAPAR